MSKEFIVTGTGGSRRSRVSERVQILAGIQGVPGRDGTVFRWLGSWDSGTAYTADDAVFVDATGAAYLCIGSNQNANPDNNPEFWSVLADPRQGIINHEAEVDPHPQYTIENGFDDGMVFSDVDARDATTISWDDGTRTLTLTNDDDSDASIFASGRRGVLAPSASVAVQIPDVSGLYLIYADVASDLGEPVLTANYGFSIALIEDYALVAVVYWGAAAGEALHVGDERHGRTMDAKTHRYNHNTTGTRFASGGGIGDLDVDGSGADDSAGTFSVGSTEIWDEDLAFNLSEKLASGEIPVFYREGTGDFNWKKGTSPTGAGGEYAAVLNEPAGRALWNDENGGDWQTVEVDNLDFVNAHIFATNAIPGFPEFIAIMGQGEYNTPGQARTGAEVELGSLVFGALENLLPEYVPLATIIYQTSNGYSNPWMSRTRSADDGDYVDWRVSQASAGAVGATDHNALTGRSALDAHPASSVTFTDANVITDQVVVGLHAAASAPAIEVSGGANQTGIGAQYAHFLDLITNGVRRVSITNSGGIALQSTGKLSWADGSDPAGATSLNLHGYPANHRFVINDLVAGSGSLLVANSWSSESQGEAFGMEWESDVFYVRPFAAGTGVARDLALEGALNVYFRTASTVRWQLDEDGHLTPIADNVYDVGASDATVRNVYSDGFVAGGGAASTPSLRFRADADTGLFSHTADVLGFSTNGAGRMILGNSELTPFSSGLLALGTTSLPWYSFDVTNFITMGVAGTKSSPSLRCASDLDTGIFFDSADSYLPHVSNDDVDQGAIVGKKMDAGLRIAGGTIPSPTGAVTHTVRRFEVNGTIVAAYSIVTGGTSVTVNAGNNGSDICSSDQVITAGAGWTSLGTLQNTAVTKGQAFTIEIVSVSGSPTECAIQIEVQPS